MSGRCRSRTSASPVASNHAPTDSSLTWRRPQLAPVDERASSGTPPAGSVFPWDRRRPRLHSAVTYNQAPTHPSLTWRRRQLAPVDKGPPPDRHQPAAFLPWERRRPRLHPSRAITNLKAGHLRCGEGFCLFLGGLRRYATALCSILSFFLSYFV